MSETAELATERATEPSPTPTFNEPDHRRPGFQEGSWVTLLDGQDWCFCIPAALYDPAEEEGGPPTRTWVIPGVGDYPDPFAVFNTGTPFSDADVLGSQFGALWLLFRSNYDLDYRDFRRLVRLVPSDTGPAELVRMSQALRDVVYGRARPKSPTGDGSD